MMMGVAVAVFAVASLPAAARGQKPAASTPQTGAQVPESNRTTLGLYVTPQEAYAMSKADPKGVRILDVRTFEEYLFVGHVEGALNVPVIFPGSIRKARPRRAGRPDVPGRPTLTSSSK